MFGRMFGRVPQTGLPRYREHKSTAANQSRRERYIEMVRSRIGAVYVGDHTVLCTVLGRYPMYIDTLDLSIGAHLVSSGYWELWVTETLVSLLRPGMVSVDIGANLGYFSLVMAEKSPGGRIHAFEPSPDTAALLRRTIAVNGLQDIVDLRCEALGSGDEPPLALILDRTMAGGNHLVAIEAVHGRDHRAIVPVRLDMIAGANEAELVKIDAEGAEHAIWRGMAGMIAGTRLATVLIEFAAMRYADPAGFLAEIARGGFSFAAIDQYRGILPTSPEAILNEPAATEWMLLLRR